MDLARLDRQDVVYEPGPGVGVLTIHLAPHVAHVHAIELDERMRAPLEHVQELHSNVTVHWADAARLDPATLVPVPTALVSNLPYHVATPIIAETLGRAPQVKKFCVMVQREIADRLFADVGGPNYAAVSVFVQTLCRRSGLHAVGRKVFLPPPHVDSSLIAFERIPESARPIDDQHVSDYARFLKDSFAHRRKTLANNLLSSRSIPRDEVVSILADIGHGPSARPQELEPYEFAAIFSKVCDNT